MLRSRHSRARMNTPQAPSLKGASEGLKEPGDGGGMEDEVSSEASAR